MSLLFVISVIIAFGVAVITALKTIQTARQAPPLQLSNQLYGCFVVQNPKIIDLDFLTNFLLNPHFKELTISFEVLFRGPQKALVIFAPTTITQLFPQLKLMPIEDYSLNLTTDTTLQFWNGIINNGTQLTINSSEPLFHDLELLPEDCLFWQIVIPARQTQAITAHLLVGVDGGSPTRSQQLSLQLNQLLQERTNLTLKISHHEDVRLGRYRHRVTNPGETFQLTNSELLRLIWG